MWLILASVASKVFSFAKLIPWQVWAGSAAIGLLATWHFHAVSKAHDKGVAEVTAKWDASNAESAKAAAIERAALESRLKASSATIISDTNARILKAESAASSALEKLRAIKSAKPVPAGCIVDPDRVLWANSIIKGS